MFLTDSDILQIMPARNVLRFYDTPAYYHVYNRGAGKQPIFLDDRDKYKFLSLIDRYLNPTNTDTRSDGHTYEKYDVEVMAYCLMDNHFHMLLYQESDVSGVRYLLKSVMTAYTMYFNRRYKRSGYLFQGVFKAARISNENYLLHITRYIHMNPRSYLRYKWSSLSAYIGQSAPSWLTVIRPDDMPIEEYREFLRAYETRRAELKNITPDVVF